VGKTKRFFCDRILNFFQKLHLLFDGMSLGIILLSFIGILMVARLLIRPITKLTIATEKIGTKSFDVHFEHRFIQNSGRKNS